MGDPRFEKAAKSLLDKGEINQTEYDGLRELTEEGFEKLALFSTAKSALTPGGAYLRDIIQTVSLGAIAASLGSDLYSKVKGLVDMQNVHEKMLEKTPSLKEYPEERIRDFYEVVKTFSPKAASNPLVAGALVNKMVQFGGVDHKLVQDLANIEGPHKSILDDMAIATVKSLSGIQTDLSKDEREEQAAQAALD